MVWQGLLNLRVKPSAQAQRIPISGESPRIDPGRDILSKHGLFAGGKACHDGDLSMIEMGLDRLMGWESEIDELGRRQIAAHGMGGPEKLTRQRDQGKLNVRERLAALVDPGSFHEVGELAGFARYDDAGEMTGFQPANFLFGNATIDGRPVVATADDFTVRGGSADATIKEKTIMAEQMANEFRLPIVRIIEGSGGGGFTGNGGADGGKSFINGALGCTSKRPGQCSDPGVGGFGGGGNGGNGGAGGGGYQGGNAGGSAGGATGRGGLSYNSGMNPSNADGVNTGHGKLTIKSL